VLEDLTARIYRLLYDIAILSYGGYMDADTNWTSADGNCNHLNERYFFRTSFRSCFDNNIKIKHDNSSFNWGFDIGLALTSLTGPIAENIESSKFLSGLMTAYTADHVQSDPGYGLYHLVGGDQHWENEYNSEKEVFKKYGVAHTNYMRRKILGIGINHTGTDKNFTDPIPKDVITEFFEEDLDSSFAKCSLLRERLEEEWESINDATVTGLSAENTLETLWEFDNKEALSSEKATSSNISDQLDTYQGTVSHVLNQLSIEGKRPSDSVTREFEHDEIVYYEGGEWKLTDYGNLLLYHVFEREMDPEWFQEAAICDGYKERPSDAGSDSSVQETALSEGDPPPHSNYSKEEQDLLEAAVSYHYE
jgi:hypothetical protein